MKIFYLLILLLLAHIVDGQTVKGIVQNSKGNQPIENAVIGIEKTSFGTISDEEGKFEMDSLPEGKYVITISSIGFRIFTKHITLVRNKEVIIEARLTEEVETKEEVVITGNLKESYISDSPIKVDILTPVLFKKNPTPTIFEALQMVNGVQPQINCNVCNTGDIHINGMEGPYTMITIDGMPIVSSLGTVYGLSGIPNSIVRRIEIVKGPASTLYGSEAVGGLINIITKDPESAPLVYADVLATSQKEYNVDLSTKSKLGKVSLLTGVNYFNFQNLLDINKDNFTDLTQQHRISVFNKLSLARKENRLATAAIRYVYEDRWGGELQWNKSFRGGDSIYGESVYTSRWELLGTYQLPVKEKITFQYSVNTHHQNSAYGKTFYKALQNIAFAQFLWNKKIGLRNDILIGLPVRYTFYDDNTPGTAEGDSIHIRNVPQKILLPGLFVQHEFKANEKLLLLGGIRYDYNSVHGNIFSPRVGLKYNLNKNNTIRVSAGNGYRVVNLFTEDHAALTGARKVVIREGLEPEKSWNGNLNFQKYINHKHGFINLDGGLFYTYFNNKIIGDFITDQNFIYYNNLKGYAISKGVLANAEIDFTFGLKTMFGITIMDVYSIDPELSGKTPQMYAPKTSGTFAITYLFKNVGLAVDYTGRITGPMYLPVVPNDFRPERSPWYSIQNIQVTKKFKNKMEIYTGIKNLLDFVPKNPILRPGDPFDKNAFKPDGTPSESNPNGYSFDPSYNYSPIQGRRLFLGLRYSIE